PGGHLAEAGDGSADVRDLVDAGLAQPAQVVGAPRLLLLEVPALHPDAARELRGDAPREVLQLVGARLVDREHGRRQSLRMPVLVAEDRPDVMGGGDTAL